MMVGIAGEARECWQCEDCDKMELADWGRQQCSPGVVTQLTHTRLPLTVYCRPTATG